MKGDLQRIVGENLRAYRLARKISQEDFAYTLGVHRAYLSGVERGQRNLTLQTVEGMAAVLEIEPLKLLQVSDR
ncbi:MAG TPA: helix-turn-helix transcriptional regulator [Solirubrobacterales bacterium]|jgi:transcriptional regulator with XRE-family HTH domain|nr:helix-turn-helix transcriptional regulator [Solirubrobacterales bacterium]